METQSQVAVTDTDSARQYLVQWMRTNFPTDQTFSTYIQSDLAGDFAWQLATALAKMEGAAGASPSADANNVRERLQAAVDAREALQEALEADKDMSEMPHWGGIHHDMYQKMRTIAASLKRFADLFPVLLPAAQPFSGPWTKVEDGMPEDRVRVWASSGKFDIGHDCFFGRQTSFLKDPTRMWRYTHSEEPVERPVTHWMSLPDQSPDSEDLRDPFAALNVPAHQN